jgi:pimeloyl-ACP methyl ester carboxylesterase
VSALAQEGSEAVNTLPNIVLVHGAWADGSSWSAVIERLQADGYTATAPQFPLTTLADNVARLRQVLARQNGPTIVAGHSYGGQIMTALGTDAPGVVGLVYIAAFGLDQGEAIGALLSQGPPSPALAHLNIDQQGFAWLPEDDFVHHFAADVDAVKARVMYAVQQPLAATALQEVMGVPAWKALPSWYLVADGDQAIPPDAERLFARRMGATTVEVPTNHVAMVSHPEDVVQLIETAAQGQVGYEQDIKPLFRPRDRQSMRFAFDLWSYQDVSAHADAILQRLLGGTMPCDGAWPSAQVELFRRWIEAGKQP